MVAGQLDIELKSKNGHKKVGQKMSAKLPSCPDFQETAAHASSAASIMYP